MKPILRRAALAAAFFALSHAAFAQAPATVQLEDLTWTELRDQIHAGKTTIIIPIGGTEQSGPYVALGKHNIRVKVLSERIAQGLGNAIVAPVIAYVPEGSYAPPTSHMRFPGTITVPDDDDTVLAEADACYDRYASLVDTFWQATGDEVSAFEARRAEALTAPLQACLTKYGVDWAEDESFDDLLDKAFVLLETERSDCILEIGYPTWQG